jgi:hypothetical protein
LADKIDHRVDDDDLTVLVDEDVLVVQVLHQDPLGMGVVIMANARETQSRQKAGANGRLAPRRARTAGCEKTGFNIPS